MWQCATALFLSFAFGAARSPASPSNRTESPADAVDCRNPLFSTHWAGKSDVRHLEATPTAQSGLRLCPFYNGRNACCPAGFEDVINVAFNRWVDHLRRQAKHIESFKVELVGVQVSEAYVKATELEQALLDKALDSFGPVLSSYGDCFDTILEYLAGVLCFSCDPAWRSKVFMDADQLRVAHLKIDDNSNEALWQSCMQLGDAGARLQIRVSDSALAKSIGSRFVDLSMFASKISISEYMAQQGVLVMRDPGELELRVAPKEDTLPGSATAADTEPVPTQQPTQQPTSEPVPADTRQLAASSAADTVARAPATSQGGSLLDPVHDGRQSGLQCSAFPRSPLQLLDSGTERLPAVAALIAPAISSVIALYL